MERESVVVALFSRPGIRRDVLRLHRPQRPPQLTPIHAQFRPTAIGDVVRDVIGVDEHRRNEASVKLLGNAEWLGTVGIGREQTLHDLSGRLGKLVNVPKLVEATGKHSAGGGAHDQPAALTAHRAHPSLPPLRFHRVGERLRDPPRSRVVEREEVATVPKLERRVAGGGFLQQLEDIALQHRVRAVHAPRVVRGRHGRGSCRGCGHGSCSGRFSWPMQSCVLALVLARVSIGVRLDLGLHGVARLRLFALASRPWPAR
mmetsp:Transcript_42491/g.113338  ORF Transcript_42491/g.113338 Transcript_42491/m.113338 type:complete len:259 (+) Transcript_42491:268-1044(+)